MLKGYITRWKEREKPEEQHIVDVGFDHRAEKAPAGRQGSKLRVTAGSLNIREL